MEPIETSPTQKDGCLAQLRNETYLELCLSCPVKSKTSSYRTSPEVELSPSYIALFSQCNGSNCLRIAYLNDAIQAKACSRREFGTLAWRKAWFRTLSWIPARHTDMV